MSRAFLYPRAIGALLAACAIISATPASADLVSFTGTFTNDTPTPGPSALCSVGQIYVNFSPATATTSGASNFGGFGPSQSHCLTPPPASYTNGLFNFAFDAGDALFGTTAGSVSLTATPGIFDTAATYFVTGGTGRFLDASGTIFGVGVLDRTLARPLNTTNLSGALNLPAIPEPATWALLILGFGGIGAVLRRQRQDVLAAG